MAAVWLLYGTLMETFPLVISCNGDTNPHVYCFTISQIDILEIIDVKQLKRNTRPRKNITLKRIGIVNQWGGKSALFFTYTHLSHDLTTGLLVALLPFIRQDLGLNYLQAGFLVSAFSLTAGLSQLLGGRLSHPLGSRKVI